MVVCAEPQDGPATRLDQAPGAVDQLLHHRFDPTSIGFVAHWRVGSEQAMLAQAKYPLSGRQQAFGPVAAGVHATVVSLGAKTEVTPDLLS